MLRWLPNSATAFSLRRNVEEVNSEEENSEEVTGSTPDYSTMTLKELKEVADDKGISYSNRVSKASLINKIEEES